MSTQVCQPPVVDQAGSARPTSIEACPDELLVMIFHALPDDCSRDTVRALSIVSRRFHRLAHDFIYSSAQLKFSYNSYFTTTTRISNVELLLRTAVEHPELARKIKHLSMEAGAAFVKYDTASFSGLEPIEATQGFQWRVRGFTEIPRAGLLIARLPELEHLDMDLFAIHYKNLRGSVLRNLFKTCDFSAMRFSSIAGLRNLKTLKLNGGDVEWPWFTLPHLQEVVVGHNSHIMPTNQYPDEHSDLSSLIFNLSVLADLDREHLFAFLPHFPRLRQLTFDMNDFHIGESFYVRTNWGILITALGHVASTLEMLKLVIPWLGSGYNWEFPSIALTNFPRLKALDIPEAVLLGSIFDGAPLDMSRLPSSIKTFDISYPTMYILDWLEHLYAARASFPHLSAITIHCPDCTTALRVGDLGPTMATRPVWRQLWQAGIRAVPVDSRLEFDEGWWDGKPNH